MTKWQYHPSRNIIMLVINVGEPEAEKQEDEQDEEEETDDLNETIT